ncbi:synaptonemal complex central element protein 2 [Osmerus mordax]|uniref:synaptonemal complex central element protein 2 n=1 Tax=Osmerus mordax TaxID=8014 RepID=UPI00350F8B6B
MNMDQFYIGESGPGRQSTSKSTYTAKERKTTSLTRPGIEHDLSGDDTLSFDLDESHEQQSEDSGANMSIISDREESSQLTFTLNSRIEEIGMRAQNLVERINQSRATDQEIMTSFENKLMSKVSEVCLQVKEQMFRSYDEHGRVMEGRLKELSEVLARSSQLSTELQGASHTLTAINMGLQQRPGL